MVQAYLGKPDYLNAMNMGLQNRLAYDSRKSRSRPVVGGGGGGNRLHESEPAPFSPEDRAIYRNKMVSEDMNVAKLGKAEADVDYTKAATNKMAKETEQIGKVDQKKADLANKLAEEKIKSEKLAQQATVLDNMAKFAYAASTPEELSDLFDWAAETGQVPRSSFASLETLSGKSPVELKILQSQIASGSQYEKNLVAVAKAQAAEEEKAAKALAAEEKELKAEILRKKKEKDDARDKILQLKKTAHQLQNSGGVSDLVLKMLPPEEQARQLAGGGTELAAEYNAEAERLAQEYGIDMGEIKVPKAGPTPREEIEKMESGSIFIGPDGKQYRKR